jgi:hypothetical protein
MNTVTCISGYLPIQIPSSRVLRQNNPKYHPSAAKYNPSVFHKPFGQPGNSRSIRETEPDES